MGQNDFGGTSTSLGCKASTRAAAWHRTYAYHTQHLLGMTGKVQKDGARSAAGDKKVQDEVVRAAKELKKGVAKATAQPKPSKKRKAAKAAAAGAVAVGAVVVAKKALSKDEDEFEYTP